MSDLSTILIVAFGIVALFGITIIVALRFGRGQQGRAMSTISAVDAAGAIMPGGMSSTDLIYGVWQTSLADVRLIVRDQNDAALGVIVSGPSGTSIEFAGNVYLIRSRAEMSESADLIAATAAPAEAVLCAFTGSGWAGQRTARYEIPSYGTLTIAVGWSAPWRRAPLSIRRDGREIGRLAMIGRFVNQGRALTLTREVPGPVRLMILWKAAGGRVRTKSN